MEVKIIRIQGENDLVNPIEVIRFCQDGKELCVRFRIGPMLDDPSRWALNFERPATPLDSDWVEGSWHTVNTYLEHDASDCKEYAEWLEEQVLFIEVDGQMVWSPLV